MPVGCRACVRACVCARGVIDPARSHRAWDFGANHHSPLTRVPYLLSRAGTLFVENLCYTDFTPTVQSYGCSLFEHGLKDVRPCQRSLSRLMKVTSVTRRKRRSNDAGVSKLSDKARGTCASRVSKETYAWGELSLL